MRTMRSISLDTAEQTIERLQQKLADAHRRLQLGKQLAEHMLKLERRLRLGSGLDDGMRQWLLQQPVRMAAWLDMLQRCDTEGNVNPAECALLNELLNTRQRRYMVKKLAEEGCIEILQAGDDGKVKVIV